MTVIFPLINSPEQKIGNSSTDLTVVLTSKYLHFARKVCLFALILKTNNIRA